ncbi:MAG TPA: winged helix DNA-binding domain-containing protein [Gaiellaceae bacterium]|nr:winged helix DNA-binding domain-containing protein [Gaiellaceae bacterium]
MTPVLGRRALNRATLARQLLLERADLAPLDAVRHLVGLQSQVPHNPYTGLWSRLAGFRPRSLSRLLAEREVVRIGVMRGTIHLITADDCLVLRPVTQPVLEGQLWRHRDLSPQLRGVDLDPVVEAGRRALEEPRTGTELRALLASRFPTLDAAALAYACQMRLALVQVPPRGLWGRSAQVRWTTVEAWLGRPLEADPSLDDVVLRYLAAFGPTSVSDVTTWCRLTGLRDVVERLRPRLVTFRDERGRELLDLPDAPRPGPDVPAPVRFLPEYDNLLLSHDDRSRFVSESDRALLRPLWSIGWGAVLHDGAVRAIWRAGPRGLVVRHVPLAKRGVAAIGAEGRRLARFLELEPDVRLEPVSP